MSNIVTTKFGVAYTRKEGMLCYDAGNGWEECGVDEYYLVEALLDANDKIITANAEIKKLQEKLDIMQRGIHAVDDLIAESYGVSGLHLNGDIAEWDSLRTGGRFENWLLDFDRTLDYL